jgi:exodeoxyribonuclease VII small subunit
VRLSKRRGRDLLTLQQAKTAILARPLYNRFMPAKKPAIPPAVEPAAEPATYEAAMAELEQLVRGLETGQMPLDELLAQHQRGSDLLAYCRVRLAQLESQVEVLKDQADGKGSGSGA